MKLITRCVAVLVVSLLFPVNGYSHCEIPCGIYDDKVRITLIAEHIKTIEKSILQIQELEKAKDHHANQLIRWVMNKENHANELQEIVTQYFMTQRIKPDSKNYVAQISLLHQMLISAMKCKQTVDTAHTEQLGSLLAEFEKLYFAPH